MILPTKLIFKAHYSVFSRHTVLIKLPSTRRLQQRLHCAIDPEDQVAVTARATLTPKTKCIGNEGELVEISFA
jgi:hypothetical protein